MLHCTLHSGLRGAGSEQISADPVSFLFVGYTEAIHFDGLSPTRGSVTDPRFRYATSARRAFYGQVAVPMRLPEAGRSGRGLARYSEGRA